MIRGFASQLFLVSVLSAQNAAPALSKPIDEILRRHPGTSAAVWLARGDGRVLQAREAEQSRPAASAIKTAIAIELFAAYAGHLEEPLPGARKLLADDRHPAIRHFNAKTRERIRRRLGSACVRRIGEMMISGRGVSNAVYNAATNLAMAHLGGPEATTRLIHARDPAFKGLVLRRYMLAARNDGDNEATAASLGAVLLKLAQRRVPGIDAPTTEALRLLLLRREDPKEPGWHHRKTGALNSEPPCRIDSAWWEHEGGLFVAVVMVDELGRVLTPPFDDTTSAGSESHPIIPSFQSARAKLVTLLRQHARRDLMANPAGFLARAHAIPDPAGKPHRLRRHPLLDSPRDAILALIAARPEEKIALLGDGDSQLVRALADRVGPRTTLQLRRLNPDTPPPAPLRGEKNAPPIAAQTASPDNPRLAPGTLNAIALSLDEDPRLLNDPKDPALRGYLDACRKALVPEGRLVLFTRRPGNETKLPALRARLEQAGFTPARALQVQGQSTKDTTFGLVLLKPKPAPK